MTDDDRLRRRLAATDPLRRDGAPGDPPSPAEIRERVMTTVHQPSPSSADPSPGNGPARRRPRLALAAAGVAVLAAAAVGVTVLGGDDPTGRPGPSAMTLQAQPGGVAGSCLAFDVTVLREMPVALAGTVTEVTDRAVTLDVDRWYAGGSGDRVTIRVPDAQPTVALDGVELVDGERYLVTATDGTVNGCGFSGPATPELESAFDEAFGG